MYITDNQALVLQKIIQNILIEPKKYVKLIKECSARIGQRVG
jgi:hypothetical protein